MRKIVIATFVLTIAAFMPSFAGVGVNGLNNNMSLRGVDKVNDAAIYKKDNICHPELVSGSVPSKNSKILNKFQNDRIFANAKGTPTGFAAEIAPTLGDDSIYSISKGSESDYNFSTYTYNSETGDITRNYYKINLKPEKMTTSGNVTWHEVSEEGENTIKITLPNNHAKYYKYTYTNANNYTETSERLNNNLTTDNVNKMLFKDITNSNSGGAIYNSTNSPEISIMSDFISNISNSYGGGIYTSASLLKIEGDFINNKAGNVNSGSAIYLTSNSTPDINGTFINNSTTNDGGAVCLIDVNAKDATICGNFVKNKTAILLNCADLKSVSGTFIDNYSHSWAGGAIMSCWATIENIDGVFIHNYLDNSGYGGAIMLQAAWATNPDRNISGIFIENYVDSLSGTSGGGAICTISIDKKMEINGTFLRNHTYSPNESGGGAIWHASSGHLYLLNSDFEDNYAQSVTNTAKGGGLVTDGITDIINSNFYSNYAVSESGTAQGGAIYTTKSLNIIADDGTSTFQGNYVQSGENEKDYQAIWVSGANTNLNLQQVNSGEMYMYDNINGTDGYTVNIEGDGTGTLYLYNDIKNANVTVDNTTINTANGEVHTYNFNSFHIASNFNFEPDVDLVNEKMDRITSENVTAADGAKLNVSKLHLMNDATKDVTKITFADSNLAEHVKYTGSKFVSYSPIYKYETSYNLEDDGSGNILGRFTFLRGSTSSPDSYNPAVLTSSVATTAGTYATQLQTFGESFQHADNYMAMTNSDRIAYKNANRYADEGISDVNVFSPIMTSSADKGFWVKPYATFERVPLRHGPKVSNISYGTLMGYDTPLKSVKYGFDRVFTYYIGYNGSTQHYSGIDGYQNGGLIGATMTFYKGNFFNATTLSVGANVGEASTMYGHDYFTSLMSGIGNKTGYNFEFSGGKFIIQPNLFMGYSFIKTFDYTNKAGVRIESDPMSAIQIAPGVKFIANTKRGWQPYLAINMVWNIFAHNKTTANGVRLPSMSIDPYVQYGLGIQKRFKDRFMAFAQAMIHNGGRNGVSLAFGLRWALGK